MMMMMMLLLLLLLLLLLFDSPFLFFLLFWLLLCCFVVISNHLLYSGFRDRMELLFWKAFPLLLFVICCFGCVFLFSDLSFFSLSSLYLFVFLPFVLNLLAYVVFFVYALVVFVCVFVFFGYFIFPDPCAYQCIIVVFLLLLQLLLLFGHLSCFGPIRLAIGFVLKITNMWNFQNWELILDPHCRGTGRVSLGHPAFQRAFRNLMCFSLCAFSAPCVLTCFYASFCPFCPLCWQPLFLPFSGHLFALFSHSKSSLFCRAKGTAQILERSSFRMDLSTKFGKEIPYRNPREKESVFCANRPLKRSRQQAERVCANCCCLDG